MPVSACDPLNMAGVLTPGARVPAVLGNVVLFRDGVPLASRQGGELHWHADVDEATRASAIELAGRRNGSAPVAKRGGPGLRPVGTSR